MLFFFEMFKMYPRLGMDKIYTLCLQFSSFYAIKIVKVIEWDKDIGLQIIDWDLNLKILNMVLP